MCVCIYIYIYIYSYCFHFFSLGGDIIRIIIVSTLTFSLDLA